ncbi:hypothetical protein OT109_14010 [Phycisphaeraceae bacterium D3-23]
MARPNPLSDALSRCEADLQRVAAEAMASGDYATARAGLELAEGIADQRARAGLEASAIAQTLPAPSPGKPAKPAAGSKPRKTQAKTARSTSGGKAYPKFAREDDKLIKIGWSKRTRTEYQHKAPRSAVDTFIAHLRKHTKADRIFKIDDLLPVPDPSNEGDLPAYQVYLVLAWLRDLGTVDKHGRDGYSAKPTALTEKSLAQAWKQLPSTT